MSEVTALQKSIIDLMNEKPFLLQHEVAIALGCSTVTVSRAAKLGDLTGIKHIKKSVRTRIEDFVNSDSYRPGMLQRDIAEAVHCTVRSVSRAILDMPKLDGATKHHPFVKPKKPIKRRQEGFMTPAQILNLVDLSESGKLLSKAW